MPRDAFPPGADAASLGPRLARLRREQGLTQAQLAGTRFTRAYVSSIEAGKRTPAASAARHFATQLGLSLAELCFDYAPGERPRLLHSLAQARVWISDGHGGRAERACRQALERAEECHDLEIVFRARCGLGLLARHTGDAEGALGLFQAADEVLAGQPVGARLPAVIGRVGALFSAGRIHQALGVAEDELTQLEDGEPGSTRAAFALACARVLPLVELGELHRAADVADTALAMASAVDDPEVLALGYYHISRALAEQGRCAQAEHLLTRATTLNADIGLRTEVGTCHFALGYLLAGQDRLPQAEAELRRTLEILEGTGATPRQVNAGAELAQVLCRLGRQSDAAAVLADCRTLAATCQDPEQAAELDRIDANIAIHSGQKTRAETLLHRAVEQYSRIGAALEVATTCRILGDLLMAEGRTADAAAIYRHGLTFTPSPAP